MTSLRVICGLGPPNQKSWLRLCMGASIETLYVTILGTLGHVTAIMETKFRQKMVKFEQIYLG